MMSPIPSPTQPRPLPCAHLAESQPCKVPPRPTKVQVRIGVWGALLMAMPGACLEGEVALTGGLQTSTVGCPVECVASVTQALEAARGVDADVVTGPLEGTLVNVCGHRETGWGVSLR